MHSRRIGGLNLRTLKASPNIAQFITDFRRQDEINILNLLRVHVRGFQNAERVIRKIDLCI